MQTEIKAEIAPFAVPSTIKVLAFGNADSSVLLPLTALKQDDVEILCDEFRWNVYKTAGISIAPAIPRAPAKPAPPQAPTVKRDVPLSFLTEIKRDVMEARIKAGRTPHSADGESACEILNRVISALEREGV